MKFVKLHYSSLFNCYTTALQTTTTNPNLQTGKAIPIFQRGNKDDKAFAKTVTKRIHFYSLC